MSLEEIDSNPQGRFFEGFSTSVGEATANMVEIPRELELEVGPEYVTELLQFHDRTWMDEELFLTDEQRKWSLEMESTPGEDAMRIVEMTTMDLEHYQNLVDRSATEFEKTDSNFEISSTEGKMLSNSVVCYKEIIH